MIKKFLLFIFIFFVSITSTYAFIEVSLWWKWNSSASCRYAEWASLSSFLNGCRPQNVVWWVSDMKVEWWFKTTLNRWIKNISLVLWLLAVWCLVYAWLLMQLSAWEDEQIKKWKNIVKWTVIWFLLLIWASWIVYIVINLMYWLWW